MSDRPVISVFGSSAPKPGDADYEAARKVGRLLAEAGFTVSTGGYMGTMEAVSRGACEANGHVIGVTCTVIEDFRAKGANEWVKEEIRYETLRDRLLHLIDHNEGMITLPGGIGTLSEMSLAWSLIQVGEITPRPMILMGKMWVDTMAAFVQRPYVHEEHEKLVRAVLTPEESVAALREALGK